MNDLPNPEYVTPGNIDDELKSGGHPVKLPVMEAVAANRESQAKQPCQNLGIVALLHLRPTLVAIVKAWISLGANPHDLLVIAKAYNYPEGDIVRIALQDL